MKTNVFLACVFSHILFDFVFQEGKLLHYRFPSKENSRQAITLLNLIKIFKGNIFHAAMHFIGLALVIIYVVSMGYNDLEYLFIVNFFIFFLHLVIDLCKSLLYLYDTKSESRLIVFFTDQILHLLVIFMFCYKFDIRNGILSLLNVFNNFPNNMTGSQKLIISLIVFFVSTWSTGVFIKLFIKKLDSCHVHTSILYTGKDNNDFNTIVSESGKIIKTISQEAKNGGFIIGILERIFIIISIMMNYTAVIGFVLTAKSFARLNKLSDESFAEYFIIGNLISFISAVIGGIILKGIYRL